jgi:di/tricarboxylate transporter
MTVPQIEAVALVATMLLLFISDRLRYDLVAAMALLAGIATGVVPPERAFTGFSSPVVVIIASVLVVSRAVAASGMVDDITRRLLPLVRSRSAEVFMLTTGVTFLSAFIKNIGALAMFIPAAMQIARGRGQPLSIYLMPLAFGSLIGGTMTQVGTSPNLLISAVRQQLGAPSFQMFDFLPVGLPLSCIAILVVSVGWGLLPRDRKGAPSAEDQFSIDRYTTELRVPSQSKLVDKSVGELEELATGKLAVMSVVRGRGRKPFPGRSFSLAAGDIVAVQGDATIVKVLVDSGGLELVGAGTLEPKDKRNKDEIEIVEAAVLPDSPLVNRSPRRMNLRHRYEVNLLAVRRAGQRVEKRLASMRLQPGDVLILQAWRSTVRDVLGELRLVPLADRSLTLGQTRQGWLPMLILAAAMILVVLRFVPVEVAFFGTAVCVVLLRQLSLKEAYDAVDWPMVVMIGALIPVGEALQHTRTTDLIAGFLTWGASHVPDGLALAMVLITAMLLTPLLHHAATVLVLGPVAASLAGNLGFKPDPFLMAVALGASCDFLTPIGHQNNTLVMGIAGYRFGDFWRLGLPLSVVVVVLGTPLIMWEWPLR